jgi:hypothetical protein
MKSIHGALAAGLTSLMLVAGCVAKTPHYDERFGDAVRDARLAQTLNPEADKNRDPVLGLDGRAAREAYTNYQESFKEPPAAVDVSVGSTGGGGGQSGGSGRR